MKMRQYFCMYCFETFSEICRYVRKTKYRTVHNIRVKGMSVCNYYVYTCVCLSERIHKKWVIIVVYGKEKKKWETEGQGMGKSLLFICALYMSWIFYYVIYKPFKNLKSVEYLKLYQTLL